MEPIVVAIRSPALGSPCCNERLQRAGGLQHEGTCLAAVVFARTNRAVTTDVKDMLVAHSSLLPGCASPKGRTPAKWTIWRKA